MFELFAKEKKWTLLLYYKSIGKNYKWYSAWLNNCYWILSKEYGIIFEEDFGYIYKTRGEIFHHYKKSQGIFNTICTMKKKSTWLPCHCHKRSSKGVGCQAVTTARFYWVNPELAGLFL